MTDRPNIIFISTDQQTWDAVSAYGNPHVRTPNIDRLHENGRSFTRSYCTDPVCAPARSSWMTGRYTSEIGVPFNGGHLFDDIPDLGQTLMAAGYRAVHAGKWHVDGRDLSNSFDVLYSGARPIGAGGAEYYDAATTHAVLEFFNQDEVPKPFYLQIAYVNPHDICEYEHNFEEKVIPDAVSQGLVPMDELPPLPPNFIYDATETVVQRVSRRADDALIHGRILRSMRGWGELDWRSLTWNYYRYVERVDAEIGMILGALEQMPFCDNTLVIFGVDHGEASGQHQMFQKFTLYEESVRVPLIVASLGNRFNIPKATFDRSSLVSGVDLLPTICDYAGVECPVGVRGMSLRSLVQGEAVSWRSMAYIECNYWGRALVSERYKYVTEYIPYGDEQDLTPPGPDASRRGLEQLFDLQADPYETHNIAAAPDALPVIRQFRERLLNFEGGLERRSLSDPRAVYVIREWGRRIREYWDAHPALEAISGTTRM